ncbi:ATP-binding cassette subfamily B protein [Kordia periserrulae]|uniref:ATP-binding cassette subfamily B protein n=1 Tax=Kordia periserrulae TaxID=701523 RepID=A0A2T6C4A7_9FLAO|nr:peptidase domain-containing ABC transporter [Kordia periserrulae]PTX63144.1 ATP-binding cassette subfamily B protein [Kordia periserrulae]
MIFKKKFPLYIQLNTADCGITCLRMISKYYGKTFLTNDFLDYKIVDRTGISVKNMGKLAEKFGFEQIPVQVNYEKLLQSPKPSILYWTQNHYVVLYKISKKKVVIADPALGLLTYNKEEFLKLWTIEENKGVAILLKPTEEFYNLKDNNQRFKYNFKFIFQYFKLYKVHLYQVIIGLLIGGILEILFPFFTKSIVDFGIANKDIGFLKIILLAQIVFFISSVLIAFLRRRILLHVSARVNALIISDFLIKLFKLPIKYFDTKVIGDLSQRIRDHEKIERFISQNLLSSFFSLFKLFVLSLVLFIFNKVIFLVLLAGASIEILWTNYFLDKIAIFENKRFALYAEDQEKIFELLSSVQEIKLNNIETKKRFEWEEIQVKLMDLSIARLKLDQSREGGEQFFSYARNIFIIFLCAYFVIKGSMTLGIMLAIVFILGQINSPIKQLINLFVEGQIAKLSLERLTEIHNGKEDEVLIKQQITQKNYGKIHDDIKLQNVNFSYSHSDEQLVLKDINLNIPKGKTTAIVGVSGSGKTTLLKLLLKFYAPFSGKISLGENNFENVDVSTWRDYCGAVLQDSFIFSDTIKNNIGLCEKDNNDIEDEKIIKAAKIANIYRFIESLPQKYETKVGSNGEGLSEGQKQRLLIARAVYKNPNFLFFDEATNSLDAENEKVIVDNLNSFFKGKTVLVVAHRLSTVRNADQIIVLDNGKIYEIGNHKELIDKKGKYFELIKNQLELGN